MKRLSYVNGSILLSFLFMTMFIIVVINVLFESLFMNQLSKGFYTDHAVKLQNNQPMQPSVDRHLNQYLLFTLDTTSEVDIRGVSYKGNITLPPMREGEFIAKDDLQAKEYLAVIGENRKKECRYENGEAYYSIDDTDYQVVGILGAEYASALDNSVLVNKLVKPSSIYVVDQHKSKAEEIIQLTGSKKIDESFSGYSRFFKVELINIVFYISAFFIVLFMIMNITYFWLLKKQQEIGIKQMLGISHSLIVKGIFYEYIFIALVGILCGNILCLCLDSIHVIRLNNMTLWTNLWISLITLFMALALMVYPIHKILKSSIVMKMKGLVNG